MQKIRRAEKLSSFLYLDRKAFVKTYPPCAAFELAPRACLADRAFRLNNRVNTAVSYLSDNSVSCGRTASDIEIFVNNSYKEAVTCSLWLRLCLGCVINTELFTKNLAFRFGKNFQISVNNKEICVVVLRVKAVFDKVCFLAAAVNCTLDN